MDINEYILNKLQGRILELFKETIKRGEFTSIGSSGYLILDDAIVSDAIKQLGGTMEDGMWTPPSGSTLESIVDRDGSDAYYYLLSLENGGQFFIKLTPKTLDMADELSDNALEAVLYNTVQALQYVHEDMSQH